MMSLVAERRLRVIDDLDRWMLNSLAGTTVAVLGGTLREVLEGLVEEQPAELAVHHRDEDHGDDGHQLDEDVQRRTAGVLQRVSDGVTDHSRGVDLVVDVLDRRHLAERLVRGDGVVAAPLETARLHVVQDLQLPVGQLTLAGPVVGVPTHLDPVLLLAHDVQGTGLLVSVLRRDVSHGAAHTVNNHLTALDELLRVVPRTTGVRHRDSHLHTRDRRSGQQARKRLLTEQDTADDGRQHHQTGRRNHLVQTRLGGHVHARGVVGLDLARHQLRPVHRVLELTLDLHHHLHRSLVHRRHGHTGEPVRQHSAHQQTRESAGVDDVHRRDSAVRHEGTVQRESHEGRRADRETLPDRRSRVTGGVQVVSHVTDRVVHLSHLNDTTSVVRDRAVRVDGQTDRHRRQNTKGSERDTVHQAQVEGHVNSHRHREARHDAAVVTHSQTLDHVRRRTTLGAARSHTTHVHETVARVTLRHDTDQQTRPQAHRDAQECLPVRHLHGLVGPLVRRGEGSHAHQLGDTEGGRQRDVSQTGHRHSRQRRRDQQLVLQHRLHSLTVRHLATRQPQQHEQRSDHACNHTETGHQDREQEPAEVQLRAVSRHNKGRARRLTERTEQVTAHTRDVADIVTDAVGDHTGVALVVLRQTGHDLTAQVSTHVRRLRVDTTTHTAERRHRRTAQTERGNALEQTDVLPLLAKREVERTVQLPGGAVAVQEVTEHQDRGEQADHPDAGETEAHHKTALERRLEGQLVLHVSARGPAGLESRAPVREHSDHHTDPSTAARGEDTNEERDRRERSVRPRRPEVGLGEPDERHDQSGEGNAEDTDDAVLGEKEVLGSIGDLLLDLVDLIQVQGHLKVGVLVLRRGAVRRVRRVELALRVVRVDNNSRNRDPAHVREEDAQDGQSEAEHDRPERRKDLRPGGVSAGHAQRCQHLVVHLHSA
eukprot:Hpha_TRINITY_DN16334_c0_g1::TRINITY_DN16334_c0_g1_i2::g.57871::m.57871